MNRRRWLSVLSAFTYSSPSIFKVNFNSGYRKQMCVFHTHFGQSKYISVTRKCNHLFLESGVAIGLEHRAARPQLKFTQLLKSIVVFMVEKWCVVRRFKNRRQKPKYENVRKIIRQKPIYGTKSKDCIFLERESNEILMRKHPNAIHF